MNDEEIIYCSRCGEAMKASSRYCMKCGNLNYNHPDNQNMQQFKAKEENSYQVGSGNFILGSMPNQGVMQSIANNTGNKSLCFYLTFGLYLVIVLGNLLMALSSGSFNLDAIVKSSFPLVAIVMSFIFFYLYSLELLFMKANKRWWAGLIPIYNIMILSEMVFKKKILGLISLIPFVGILYILVVFYKLGEKFRYNGIVTALLSFAMIPVIAYGDHPYDGRIFVNDDVKNSVEVEYRRKNTFFATTILFFIIGIGLFMYGKTTQVESTSNKLKNMYYIYASKTMVKKTSKAIDNGEIICDDGEKALNGGPYYFYIDDVGDEFNLFLQIMKDPIEGYIKIEKNNGNNNYYVSLTDGKKGFSETNFDNIDINNVVDYEKLDESYKHGVACYIN